MPSSQAVVWLDHHNAQVLRLDADEAQARKLKEHHPHTRQHGNSVRTEHEFFGEVCDALAGIGEVLVTSSRTVQTDFHHYVDKHRPAVAPQIVGWEIVDHPTEGQLLADARQFFIKRARMVSTP